mgnify:CR=1 FL=1
MINMLEYQIDNDKWQVASDKWEVKDETPMGVSKI